MSYNSKGGHGYGGIRRAKRVQARRSLHAKAIDRNLKAPKARSVDQWLSAPNRFDLANVDTNKPKKQTETKSMRISEEEYWKNDNANKKFDSLINHDYIDTRIPENKKIYLKILETLDQNNIPYHIDPQLNKVDGMPDYSIDVLQTDMTKAEKLTNRLNDALRKSIQ